MYTHFLNKQKFFRSFSCMKIDFFAFKMGHEGNVVKMKAFAERVFWQE